MNWSEYNDSLVRIREIVSMYVATDEVHDSKEARKLVDDTSIS